MTHYDAAQAERATQLVADWPDFTDAQIEAVRRIVAPILAKTGAAYPKDPEPRMVRTSDAKQPVASRTSGPRGGNPVAGARAQDRTSALATASAGS